MTTTGNGGANGGAKSVKGKKQGAATIPPDDADVPRNWLSRQEVARMLGVTTTTVRNHDEDLHPRYKKGRAYYDPEVIREYAKRPEMRAFVRRAANPIVDVDALEREKAAPKPDEEDGEEEDSVDDPDDDADDDADDDDDDDADDDDDDDDDDGDDDEVPTRRGSPRLLARRGGGGARDRDDPYEGWFTIGQVAAKMRVHPQTIKSRVRSGELRPVYRGKRALFDPEEIDAITPQSLNEIASAELIQNCNAIIKGQQNHIEQMLGACVGSATALVSIFGEEIKQQRVRIRELEVERAEGRKLIDKAETEEVQRSLLVADHQEKVVLREKLLGLLETNVPSILSMVAAKVAPGSGVSQNAQAATVAAIVESLTPEQMAQIAPVLTREQATAIMGVRHAIERERQAVRVSAEAPTIEDAGR